LLFVSSVSVILIFAMRYSSRENYSSNYIPKLVLNPIIFDAPVQ